MPRARRVRAGSVKLPKTWGEVDDSDAVAAWYSGASVPAAELRRRLRDVAEAVKSDAVAMAPVRDGDLAASIGYRISPDGLAVTVGPGIKAVQKIVRQAGSPWATSSAKVKLTGNDKHALMQFYKAWWAEFGTKGSAEDGIPPQPARPFMGPAWDVNKTWAKQKIRKEINETLARVARGD